ncbi:YIP1 family protein [Ectobacillus sp. JY-23]|uniref:YIP1 family protein n=1 Tax=Ectobacillus sp. JY-23 TaxID=2933872 RepID=UPI001FF1524B|nr:YIP1 family protein [Ectobacillus sp. JY-23]UOY91137.1 YIP1 family protein [Ectobacillus sp. JY-23]
MRENILGVKVETAKVDRERPTLLGTIFAPLQNFERMKRNPIIVFPLVIIFVLQMTGTIITAFSLDTNFLLQGDVPKGSEEFLVTFTRISIIAAGGLIPFVYLFVSSGVQLFLAKFTSSDVKFKQLLSLNIHIMIITVISIWVNGLIKYFIDGSMPFYVTSFGGLVEPEGGLFGFLNGIEIFAIWHFILRAKGLLIVADFPKSFAWFTAFLFFAILLFFNIINGMTLTSFK